MGKRTSQLASAYAKLLEPTLPKLAFKRARMFDYKLAGIKEDEMATIASVSRLSDRVPG